MIFWSIPRMLGQPSKPRRNFGQHTNSRAETKAKKCAFIVMTGHFLGYLITLEASCPALRK